MAKRTLQLSIAFAALLLAVEAVNHDLVDGVANRITCRRANEIYSPCGKNSCQNTCRRPNAALGCTSTACIPGCVCAPGFLRSTRHACVLPAQCNTVNNGLTNGLTNGLLDHNSCGANEIFTACGQDGCQRTCNRLDVFNCNPVCTSPSCVCAQGFVRNAAGTCVLPANCPTATTCPGANEVFSQCGNDGCQRTCNRPDTTGCISICSTPACVCAAGFVRNALGTCILPSTCPITMTCAGANEVFSQCGNDGCQRNCNRLDVTGCISVCSNPACICATGFVRNTIGVCVLPSTCPATGGCTGANEVFSQCGNTMCQVTCSFTAAQAANCNAPCNSGCVCVPGFLRNFAGTCVPTAQCNMCPTNEQFRTCGTGVCENTCATPDVTGDPRCSTAGACTSRCFCNPGMVRNSAGMCIMRNLC